MEIRERPQEVSREKGEQTGAALPPRPSGRREGDEGWRDGSGGRQAAWMARGPGWLSLGLGLAATAAVVGIVALDLRRREQFRHQPGAPQKRLPRDRSMRVQKSVTVNRSPEELYRFWHNFENLPRFMNRLQSVQVTGEKCSHWKAKAPAWMTVEWDAEIIAENPNELIAWRSLEGADVDHAGSVRFERAPGGRGTEVRVEMQYIPPGGIIGATLAKLFGESPDQQMQEDLRRFKQLMEAGEIVQSEATVRGRGPAQPPAAPARS
jgi:uncharacterized membrane protein